MNIYLNETSFQYINNFLNILEESSGFNIPNDVKNKINKISKEAMESKKIKVALPKSTKLNPKSLKTSKTTSNEKIIDKPGKLNKAKITPVDSCFTAMLKIVGKEDIAKKVNYSAGNFLYLYCRVLQEKNRKITQINKNNIKMLKKGHIVAVNKYTCENYINNDTNSNNVLSNVYDPKYGLLRDYKSTFVRSGGHMIMILDITDNDVIMLHNTDTGNLHFGTGLELTIQSMSIKEFLGGRHKYVLDYSLFPEVEKLAEKFFK